MKAHGTIRHPNITKTFGSGQDFVRIEIPVEGCVGTNGDKIIILDAEDTLDIIVESGGIRECIHSWVKEPEL